jgi:hypothetical protein
MPPIILGLLVGAIVPLDLRLLGLWRQRLGCIAAGVAAWPPWVWRWRC